MQSTPTASILSAEQPEAPRHSLLLLCTAQRALNAALRRGTVTKPNSIPPPHPKSCCFYNHRLALVPLAPNGLKTDIHNKRMTMHSREKPCGDIACPPGRDPKLRMISRC